MKRSVIRDRLIPDYASLHPGDRAATSFAVPLTHPPSCPRPLDRCPRALGPHSFSGLAWVAAIEPGAGWSWGLRGQDLGSSGGRSDGAQIVRRGLARLSISNNVESDLLSLVSPLIPARSTALICTKTSLLPSSGWMKPKPFWTLNHFTVPCVISSSFSYVCRQAARQRSRFVRVLEESRQSDAGCAARPSRSPKLDRSNVGYCGVDRKGVALIFWAADCLRDSDCDF